MNYILLIIISLLTTGCISNNSLFVNKEDINTTIKFNISPPLIVKESEDYNEFNRLKETPFVSQTKIKNKNIILGGYIIFSNKNDFYNAYIKVISFNSLYNTKKYKVFNCHTKKYELHGLYLYKKDNFGFTQRSVVVGDQDFCIEIDKKTMGDIYNELSKTEKNKKKKTSP